MNCYRNSQAFTLIELLVVISIISLLIALLMPALAAARTSVYTVQCSSNQRQLVLLVNAYAADFAGHAPWWTSVLTSQVPSWTGPTGQAGPILYLTRQGMLKPAPTPDPMGGNTIRLCPEMATQRPDGESGGDGYSHFEFNVEITGYFRSYNSGAMAWAIPGYTAGLGPTRFENILRPSQVYMLADGIYQAGNNVVRNRAASFFKDTNNFKIGSDTTVSSPSGPNFGDIVRYRHMTHSVNFMFVDGHGATIAYDPGSSRPFGQISEDEYVDHTP